jgi:hypothetical protein
MRPLCCPALSSGRKAWQAASAPTTFTSSTRLQHSTAQQRLMSNCLQQPTHQLLLAKPFSNSA